MHDKDSSPIEAIEFKSLSKNPSQDSNNELHSKNNSTVVWVALVFIFICGVIVFIFLPKHIANQNNSKQDIAHIQQDNIDLEASSQLPEEPEAIQNDFSVEELAALKQQAEGLLLKVIKLQEELEMNAVKKWAAEEFKHAVAFGAAGDEYFRKQNYMKAISNYEQAVNEFSILQQRVQPTLENYLSLGEQSLEQGDDQAAHFHFELAIVIEANNQQAINGLKRAETIKELFSLLDKGGSLEAANRLQDAQQVYRQAVALDALSIQAQDALNRVSDRLIEIEFERLIAKGYSLLNQDQFQNARTAFNAAKQLNPSSEKPGLGLRKVEQAVRDEKIGALFVEAQHFENKEEWAYAAESYKQVLAIYSNSQKAVEGLAVNQKRAEILNRLNEYIDNQTRLSTAEVSAEAQAFIKEISLLVQPGKKITQQISKLKELLVIASHPVDITLLSNNQTQVVIYKIAKIGQFENHKITLKPGKYTIVGSRPGYRDVRKVVTVSSTMQTKNISVQCDEKI